MTKSKNIPGHVIQSSMLKKLLEQSCLACRWAGPLAVLQATPTAQAQGTGQAPAAVISWDAATLVQWV